MFDYGQHKNLIENEKHYFNSKFIIDGGVSSRADIVELF